MRRVVDDDIARIECAAELRDAAAPLQGREDAGWQLLERGRETELQAGAVVTRCTGLLRRVAFHGRELRALGAEIFQRQGIRVVPGDARERAMRLRRGERRRTSGLQPMTLVAVRMWFDRAVTRGHGPVHHAAVPVREVFVPLLDRAGTALERHAGDRLVVRVVRLRFHVAAGLEQHRHLVALARQAVRVEEHDAVGHAVAVVREHVPCGRAGLRAQERQRGGEQQVPHTNPPENPRVGRVVRSIPHLCASSPAGHDGPSDMHGAAHSRQPEASAATGIAR